MWLPSRMQPVGIPVENTKLRTSVPGFGTDKVARKDLRLQCQISVLLFSCGRRHIWCLVWNGRNIVLVTVQKRGFLSLKYGVRRLKWYRFALSLNFLRFTMYGKRVAAI